MEISGKANRIIVIGHKNPDTDSICSAIACAELMNTVNERAGKEGSPYPGMPEGLYEPCRAGVISPETTFVLDRFGLPIPRLILDVHARVSDLDIREEHGILPDTSQRDAWEQMMKKELQTLPVVDEQGALTGVITLKDIAMANMDVLDAGALAHAAVPVRNILSTIGGELVCGDPDAVITRGNVTIGASGPEAMKEHIMQDDIVIVGNRPENELCAIEAGASVVIVCMADAVSEGIRALARLHGCILIRTENDTYNTSRLLNQSIPVRCHMKQDVYCFEPSSQVDGVRETMGRVRFDYFPVIEYGRVLGLISKSSLMRLRKKQLVLVDHNEKSQCIEGFDEADILAIIDHHRIGDLETTGPVMFRNVPVGCTATIIRDMYRENGVTIRPAIAGILCCAILSDTLAFRSPTCTQRDIDAANDLAALAGVDPIQLASDMFDAGEDLTGKTPEAVYRNDFKILRSADHRIAIAQGIFNSPFNLKKAEEMMRDYIPEVLAKENVDLAFYIATGIGDQSSTILYAGNGAEDLLLRSFRTEPSGSGLRIPGLVSRKKQFVPALLSALQ